MKTLLSFLLLILYLSGACQIDSKTVQLSKEDSLILRRYFLAFSKNKNESNFLSDLNERFNADFFSKFKSSLQSKKIKIFTKQPLKIDNSSKIAIVGCRPIFSIDKSVDNYCELKVVENSGLSISKDIAELVVFFAKVKSDLYNKNINFILLDSAFINEIPYEPYSFLKASVAGPTKIWGTSELPICSWSNGVTISIKPKIKKDYKFVDKRFINGKYNYIIAVWPYQWFSGWGGFEDYSMYIGFYLIDGSSGQILGSGLSHKDKFCDTYCGMEVAWAVAIDISSQLLQALSESK